MTSINRRFGDVLISIGALGSLLLLLAAFDPRMREQIALRLGSGDPGGQVAEAGATIRNLGLVVLDAIQSQSIEHAPLVIFVLAATVLVLFMLRT
jgi:hypothetical protein